VDELKKTIRSVPDFPEEGIVFRDITTLLNDADALKQAVEQMAEPFKGRDIDQVVAAEARGFILGPPVATRLDAGFVPVRKPGKLPAETVEETYELEYGTDTLTMHRDALEPGDSVLMLDDLLATGGTMAACCRMVEKMDAEIEACVFLIELDFLEGRRKLEDYELVSLIHYESEEEM
jgi:adenine phosphoribosyltransferase